MLFFIWILCNLSLVSLHQISQPRSAPDDEGQSRELRLINSYFQRTSIVRSNDTEVQYCGSGRALHDPLVDLSLVMDFYKSLGHSYTNISPGSPITDYGVLAINEKQQLPLYVIADIRRSHLQDPDSGTGFGQDVMDQMDLMGQLESDDRGHLLAFALGGSSRALNIIPMARNVNSRPELVPENEDLGIPCSYWRSNEHWIHRFLLRDYPNGRVAWRIAVQYEDDVIIHPNWFTHYRPVSFTLQFTAYTNQFNNNSVYYTSPQTTYLNSNDFSCGSEETYLRKRRDINLRSKREELYVQVQRQGRFGTFLNGGSWSTSHQVSFTYTIQGKTYFYGQSIIDGRHWFIQELLPNGQMGEEKSHGSWNQNYRTVFPFSIKGKQFFYGHSVEAKNWFIQELLPGGQMGEETSHGAWNTRHHVSFPFTIGGKQYFYGQSIIDGNHWFIQQLLPNGKMGRETSHGTWSYDYPVSFPFTINGRQFFYGHCPGGNNWFIQELLRGGKMGQETSHGTWSTGHQVSVPFKVGLKHFFYGQGVGSVFDGYHWFIQELLPGGQMGAETSHGRWVDSYPTAFPYYIGGKNFLYGHSTDTRNWFIREII